MVIDLDNKTRRGPEDEQRGTYEDTDFIDGVDSYDIIEQDTTYYDDYEDYGY